MIVSSNDIRVYYAMGNTLQDMIHILEHECVDH